VRRGALLLAAALPLLAPRASAGSAPDGAALWRANECATCHGEKREGTENAPPLRELKRHWDVERLARYLADPPALIAQDERLTRLAERYELDMPDFSLLPQAERRALADWLLRDDPAD